jgi:hypothetical protein
MSKLHRTNINLFESDVIYLQSIFGHGWTNQVRDMVAKKVKEIKKTRAAHNIGVEEYVDE